MCVCVCFFFPCGCMPASSLTNAMFYKGLLVLGVVFYSILLIFFIIIYYYFFIFWGFFQIEKRKKGIKVDFYNWWCIFTTTFVDNETFNLKAYRNCQRLHHNCQLSPIWINWNSQCYAWFLYYMIYDRSEKDILII
jgi:hypothetical protein